MQAMHPFGRGFGGPPQPQRQGGRRGMNRGGFRNSRFEPNQQQRNQGQRPNNNEVNSNIGGTPEKPAEPQQNQQINKPPQNQQQQSPITKPQPPQQLNKPQQSPQQQLNKPQQSPQQQLNKPQQSPQQQLNKPQQSPQQQLNKPQQQQQLNKPQQQQQLNKPQQQQQLNKPQQQQQQQQLNKPQQQQLNKPPQQQLNKPPQQQQQNKPAVNKPENQVHQNGPAQSVQSKDNVDLAIVDAKPNLQQPKNMNGNFGGRQSGWNQGGQGQGLGGQGNKQGGFNQGNRQFGNRGAGGPGAQGAPGQGGPARNQQRGWGGQQSDGKHERQPMREELMLANKLRDLVGPLTDIPPIDQSEVKFNGRSRLYIGNLTNDVTEDEINGMFATFGECAELFLNKEKNFGFIKMDFRVNAERAKRELDGKLRNGRNLRVRFAPHNCAIRVKNLPPWVSNELLYRGFEIFGRIERAYVKVDERGKPLGEGIVEYSRKPSALAAIRNCTDKCFFLTSSLRPVIVESFDEPDEFDGYPEKNLPKKHPEFLKAREVGPRFSELSSFEHEYGTRWKQLHELHRQKEEALKKELSAEEDKLEAQMEYAKYEHETEMLREQLRQREQDRERQKRSWEQAERAADSRRDTERAQLQRQEDEMSQRMRLQDDELRRRQQENTLFVQAQRLNSMLDRQEQGMFDQQSPMDGGFREQYDMPRGNFDDLPTGRGWEGPRQMDDFPNKRRRY